MKRRTRNTFMPIQLLALALVVAGVSLIPAQSSYAAGLETTSPIIAPSGVTEGQVVRYLVPKYNGHYTDADVRFIVDRDFAVAIKGGSTRWSSAPRWTMRLRT